RAERAISQEELGERAGLHRNYVSRIERGKVVPTLRSVERLAGALNVMPSELVSRGESWRLARDAGEAEAHRGSPRHRPEEAPRLAPARLSSPRGREGNAVGVHAREG